jgi:hypothetical protein
MASSFFSIGVSCFFGAGGFFFLDVGGCFLGELLIFVSFSFSNFFLPTL